MPYGVCRPQRTAAPSRELRRARTDRDPNFVTLILHQNTTDPLTPMPARASGWDLWVCLGCRIRLVTVSGGHAFSLTFYDARCRRFARRHVCFQGHSKVTVKVEK